MTSITIIKKVKANLTRIKIHKLFGFLADLLIYAGYMLKMSKWIDDNKAKLKYNDFYNGKVLHRDRLKLYALLMQEKGLEQKELSYIEFGLGRGNSMRWWSENNKAEKTELWGFDTFEGLPEQYGNYAVGTFSLGGNFPDIKDERINFIPGLFQNTLLQTIPQIKFDRQTIIHVDGDLYSSALYTLTMLYPYLKKGDLIIFDEFVVPYHEFKAFDDFTKSFYLTLEPIGAINNYLQIVFEVTDLEPKISF